MSFLVIYNQGCHNYAYTTYTLHVACNTHQLGKYCSLHNIKRAAAGTEKSAGGILLTGLHKYHVDHYQKLK